MSILDPTSIKGWTSSSSAWGLARSALPYAGAFDMLYPMPVNSPLPTWSFSGGVLPNAGIFDMAVRCGGTVVNSPIEKGSFFSYNKTTEPLEITATLSFEGSDTLLQSVLSNLKTLKESVTIFSIITPTYEYESMTLQNYDYSFTRDQGLGVLYVNAVFIEIKEVTVAYTQQQTITATSDASAVSEEQVGTVQTETPSSNEEQRVEKSALRQGLEDIGMIIW